MSERASAPQPIYPEESPYRVRLPGSIAADLAWPQDVDGFPCHGVFRTAGVLLCAANSTTTASGEHPFRAALEYRASISRIAATIGLDELPAVEDLVAELRVFDFDAKWTSAQRSQLDLQLGTLRTSLLGWRRGGTDPLYAKAAGGILCLFSADKVRAIQSSGVPGID